MLLITTVVPTVESLKNSAINATIPNTPLTAEAVNWTQVQKLLASDGAAYDYFGFSVSLDGDTALIGTYFDNSNRYASESVYVFTRTGTTWALQAKLFASDGSAGSNFGASVSLDGDTALIGAHFGDDDYGGRSGSAYVFIRTGTTWTQQAKFLASDGAADFEFGRSVSLSGDTALIGEPYSINGSAYVFTRTGTIWTQQQKILTSDGAEYDEFGWSVSLDGDTALIGAHFDDVNGYSSGSEYVFTRTGTTWTQQAKLLASDGEAGGTFGCSVSLDGDTALIGALGADDNGYWSGSAYVFKKGGSGLEIDIKGGLGIYAVITNHGEGGFTNITWDLQVNGGKFGLINKKMNGTVDIPAGQSKTISTGLFFGLGDITIIAKAEDVIMTTKGTQFFIFSMVK